VSESGTTPTPAEIRAELENLIVTDLRGPSSPTEQLPAHRSPVRDWYLVGMLAPKGTVVEPSRQDNADAGNDDDPTPGPEDRIGKTTMFPSSLGFTAAVEHGVSSITVEASWGRYEKIDNPDPTAVGALQKLWQRHPAGGSAEVHLAEGPIGPVAVDSVHPDVVIEGRCRQAPGCWIVTLFLVNRQSPTRLNIDQQWIFQAELAATTVDGGACFVGRATSLLDGADETDGEVRHLDLLYRDKVEFAVGHSAGIHTEVDPSDPQRAIRISSAAMPRYEVPRVEAPPPEDEHLDPAERDLLLGVTFDMSELAKLDGPGAAAALAPLVDAYDHWLGRQADRLIDPSLESHAEAGRDALVRAQTIAARLRAGVDLLASDADAATAFAFANRAMWQQRVHSLLAVERRARPSLTLIEGEAELDVPNNRTWRPFQLAFVLVNLPSLVDPTHEERQLDSGTADLLFFPTGGGKTEAYLGLTAFTLAIRRLQGVVAGHSGEGGVGVFMRYTLRLLTAQQFQRAAALICACEIRRRELMAEGDHRWGETPFRIGMWVGGSVSPNKFDEAKDAIEESKSGASGRNTNPVTLTACPWCGAPLDPARDAIADTTTRRILIRCSDPKGRCPFTAKRTATTLHPKGEGLPVVTVDEEIYRLVPDLVIATADKFAQLPWQGPTSALFGRVAERCERHGYRTPDLAWWSKDKHSQTHPAANGRPAAKTEACLPLRPPDLIIQDELHLIAGPLGSLFGLYETAVDALCSWTVEGRPARPKIVASTATVRRAEHQTYNLFCRQLAVFPPQVLDAGDSFFALERPLSEAPGRLYLGICAPGHRFKSVATRVYTASMAAAQRIYEKYGQAADPWMTAVGYFNSLRELGGMRRMLDDEVANRLRRTDRRGLSTRDLYATAELTSRVSSGDIPGLLDQLGVPFTGSRPGKGEAWPLDAVLATNMISVGVDVPRLGLMLCSGQPKATAEYIQATSRVGRSNKGPGLVITVYNWARPRDLSHYERFEHYHQTYYRYVEALSVTPFARRALDRGLTALLISAARHDRDAWNPNGAAQTLPVLSADVTPIIDALFDRVGRVADAQVAEETRKMLQARLDGWSKEQNKVGVTLTYARGSGDAINLLHTPEEGAWETFTAPNSLRDVEPTSNLLLRLDDPSDDASARFLPPPAMTVAGSPDDEPFASDAADADDLADVQPDEVVA
jgi:hypothetical protein